MSARLSPLVPTLLAAAVVIVAAHGALAQAPHTSVVRGMVVERGNRAPIEGVEVVLRGLQEDRRITDDNGVFVYRIVPEGTYLLRLRHIAYQTVEDTVDVPPESEVELDIRLVPTAIELEPIVVAAAYSTGGKMRAFYERRRTGHGSYIGRADVEEQNPSFVTDMLRRIPGLRLVPRGGGGMTLGYQVVMRGNCQPAIFIDGILATRGGLSLDEMFRPDDIEGIEIYRGPQTPAAFLRNDCGTILIWTRPGGGPRGRFPLWKMVIAGGIFAVIALILTH
jgi:hypothetical protein